MPQEQLQRLAAQKSGFDNHPLIGHRELGSGVSHDRPQRAKYPDQDDHDADDRLNQ